MNHIFFFFFKDFIYLFDRDRDSHERGNTSRGSGKGRSRLTAEEPDVGLNPTMPGSRPEPKADAQLLCPPGAPNHIFFTHSSVEGHFASFRVWLLWTSLLWTWGYSCPFFSVPLGPWGKYQVVQLLGRRVTLFLTFWGPSILFSIVAFSPTVQGAFPFSTYSPTFVAPCLVHFSHSFFFLLFFPQYILLYYTATSGIYHLFFL